MRRISWLYVATLSLGVAGAVSASDVAIVGLKLIVVDRTALLGRGKALFVAKDDQISKGSGTDPRHIEAVLHVAYDAVDGAFEMPHGGHWLANFPSIAKYVNFRAPDGGAVKMSVIEPGTLLKLIAKSAGDRPIDVSDDPQGPVYVTYAIVNGGEETRLCTRFARCRVRTLGGRGAHKLVCKGHSTGDPDCTASPSTTSTSTSTSTSTTLPSCSCGDGICRSDESLPVCADDCRIAHVVTLPVAFEDCGFGTYARSGQCNELQSSFLPQESLCSTGGSSLDAIAVLPSECGGQGQAAALQIGDTVPVANGQSSLLVALRTCWDHGIRHFVAPIIACGSLCNQSVTVVGFAPIELTARPLATGAPKGFEWSAYCAAEGPCGLGVCTPTSADCSTCPEDCGGCTPACP